MAAPTVGAVMADILPYLGVAHNYTEEDAAGRQVLVEDLTGMTEKQALAVLQEQGLTAQTAGSGDTVTGQIPAAGQTVPGDSQILLYLGEEPEKELVAVPDLTGKNRQQASDAAGSLGLYILVKGNPEVSARVTATSQSIPPGTMIQRGTTIEVTFADTGAVD